MAKDDLQHIEIRSGVNNKLEGFCTIVVTTEGNRMLLGQLEPDVVRGMAMEWMSAAEAADQDAAVLRCIRKLELPDELAGAIVTELRETRG